MKFLLLSFLLFSSLGIFAQNKQILTSTRAYHLENSFFARTSTNDSLIAAKESEPTIRKALVLDSKATKITLQTSNGCGIGNFLIPCMGEPAQGIPPTIGSIYYSFWVPAFRSIDTIPGTQIKGVAFNKLGWVSNNSVIETGSVQAPYVVISDIGMFSYLIPADYNPSQEPVLRVDSLFIPNIKKVATQITTKKTNPIVLLVEDSTANYHLQFHAYPAMNELFRVDFNFEPEIFEVVDSSLFITGVDTNGTHILYHLGAFQDTLYATYPLNSLAANPKELLVQNDSIFILSSPADTIVVLTTINRLDSIQNQVTVYSHSGARATYNDYQANPYFTFQPIADTSNGMLHQQILILNPLTQDIDTLLINKALDYFKYPKEEFNGFGYFDLNWIGGKNITGSIDSVYLKAFGSIMDLETNKNPGFINATHGCWVSIPHRELEKIEFKLYPNPASKEVMIKLSGLEKGRPYKLEVLGLDGKVVYTTSLKAYQEFKIPLHTLPSGMYFLKLDTGRNIITQKLLVQ